MQSLGSVRFLGPPLRIDTLATFLGLVDLDVKALTSVLLAAVDWVPETSTQYQLTAAPIYPTCSITVGYLYALDCAEPRSGHQFDLSRYTP